VSEAIRVAEERSLRVEPHERVRVARVASHRVKLNLHSRMAVGDVDVAFRRQLNNGNADLWPPVTGSWRRDEDGAVFFEVSDGRHQAVANLLLARPYLLVCWTEGENDDWENDYGALARSGLVRL
jgi:hypothetical protein